MDYRPSETVRMGVVFTRELHIHPVTYIPYVPIALPRIIVSVISYAKLANACDPVSKYNVS